MASRVCVKNLPKNMDEPRLRELFSSQGDVTDVRVMKTKDGSSRLFGFVGFRSEAEAKAAVRFFDKSFVGSSRVIVEPARAVNDPDAPRPWSKHSEGKAKVLGGGKATKQRGEDEPAASPKITARIAKKRAQEARAAAIARLPESLRVQAGSIETEKEFEEFLAVVGGGSKRRVWANDLQGEEPLHADAGTATEASARAAAVAATAAAAAAAEAEAMDMSGGGGSGGSGSGSGGGSSSSDGQKDAVVESTAVSDLDYLRARMRKTGGAGKGDDAASSGSGSASSSSGSADNKADAIKPRVAKPLNPKAKGGRRKDGDEAAPVSEAAAATAALAAKAEAERAAFLLEQQQQDEDADAGISGRLFFRNLPFTTTTEELERACSKYGKVVEVHIPLNKANESRGIGFALFLFPEHAARAMEGMDGAIFQGRLLHVLPGRAQPTPSAAGTAPGATTADGVAPGASSAYKAKKAAQLKASASSSHNWNALYMRADTVAAAMAAQLGVGKAELLDREAESMAVRVALGEAHVIAETKRQLEEQGVVVSELEAAAAGGREWDSTERSASVLLLKNIPFDTTDLELRELFSRFGGLARVVLPLTKTVALVEFVHANHAKKAFRSLAYSKFKAVPLYIEMAPKGVFNDGLRTAGATATATAAAAASASGKTAATATAAASTAAAADATATADAAGESVPPPAGAASGRTIFVSNISFETEDGSLHALLSGAGPLRYAKVSRRNDLKRGERLSLGYGFAEYESADSALEAMKRLQGAMLDGHALRLQFAKATVDASAGRVTGRKRTAEEAEEGGAAGGGAGTKIIVRNLAFEATRKDVQQLAAPFGAVRSVRLPKKPEGGHRGFAFVDFITRQEAVSAFEALSAAHLYGRHLVIEWASTEDDSLAAIRDKTKRFYEQQQAAAEGPPRKRQRNFSMDGGGGGDGATDR